MVARRGWLPAVRVLEVSGNIRSKVDDDETKEITEQLTLLVPGMTGLRHLHWRVWNNWATVAIPPLVLDSLPARSQLHVLLYCGAETGSVAAARDFLLRLNSNQNLQTVACDVKYRSGLEETMPKIMRALKEVLLSCPNLTRLYYQSTDPSGTRSDPGGVGSCIGLDLVDGEIPATLEEIRLGRYEWGLWYDAGDQKGRCARPRPEHLHWVKNLDWSRLTTLRQANEVAAEYLVPKMVSLKHLEVGFDYFRHGPFDVLKQVCSPLEVLCSSGHLGAGHGRTPDCLLIMAAARFGASLRELRVHHADGSRYSAYGRPSDLLELGRGLPRLETLELDAKLNDDYYNNNDSSNSGLPWADYLDAVAAGFSNLRTLELWTVQPKIWYLPAVAVGLARRMFARLRERNRRIQRLVVHYGIGHIRFQEVRRRFFHLECTIAYKKNCAKTSSTSCGGGGDSYIRVTSPDLGSAQNRRLDELAQLTGGNGSDRSIWGGNLAGLDEMGMLLKATLEGPELRKTGRSGEPMYRPGNNSKASYTVHRTHQKTLHTAKVAKEIIDGGVGGTTGPPQLMAGNLVGFDCLFVLLHVKETSIIATSNKPSSACPLTKTCFRIHSISRVLYLLPL